MLHTDEEPPQQGWSLKYMQWMYKIEDKLKLTKTGLDVFSRQNIGEHTMNEIYNFMDVFCYGTGGEGFGLPGIECQACGVPLLMTDCSTALDLCRPENRIPVLKDKYNRDVDVVGTNGVAFKVPDDMAMAGLGWGFIVIMATITLVFSGQLPDRTIAIKMLVSLLIFEVAAAVGLLKAIIERSEVKTREKLLKIEYRIAEISEKMEKNQEKP